MTARKYASLFEPLQLKHLTLKNRIVKSAQWLIYPEPDGSVGDRVVAFYDTLAAGGLGLVTVEESICEYPLGASNVPHIRLDDDRFLPGLTRLADTIHSHDVPAIVQITHAGPAHNPLQPDDGQPVAPSSLDPPTEPTFAVARELTVPEIHVLVEKFAQAALRCKMAGFDGVEIHMAHYALVNAFLSRIQNKRLDEFGCASLEDRARFSCEILRSVRESCGDGFVLGVRMNAQEWGHELGTTNDEAIEFAKLFQTAGADYIQASSYGYGEMWLNALPDLVLYPEVSPTVKAFADRIPMGALLPEAARIRAAVTIPVSGVGRLSIDSAAAALEDGKVDLVCLGRRLLADPELPRKVAEDRVKEIRPCLGCSYCLHTLFLNQPVECRVNAFMGHDADMAVVPAASAKTVMVVGAGPAGLEAARVAALRGHHVTVYDKAREIGGLLPMAAFIKGKEPDDLEPLLDYYRHQFDLLDVKVELGAEVTPDLVKKVAPDAVILAPGGMPAGPDIPVSGGAKPVTTDELKSKAKGVVRWLGPAAAAALTKVFLPTGKRVVVVGGDLAGLEAAEFLAKRGKEVTIVEAGPQIGRGALIQWMVRYMPWLAARGIPVYSGATYKEITRDGLLISTAEGEDLLLEADTVMIITQYARNAALYDALDGLVPERYLIGDAKADDLTYIAGCVRDGANAGLAV
jgi:2,4-dienoyl-CoA reductase (NADPH2)